MELIGYPQDSVESIPEFIAGHFPATFITQFKDFMTGTEERSSVLRARVCHGVNGGSRWLLVRGRVVERDRTTAVPVVVTGSISDVTDQVDHEQALEKFNQLSAQPDLSLEEKINQALEVLRRVIGGDFARINQLQGDQLEVRYGSGDRTGMAVGTRNSVGVSLCGNSIRAAEGISAINNLEQGGYADHPARQKLGVESYVGARITVQGETFGTICITADRPIDFTDLNKNLLKSAAYWLGGQIELERNRESLRDAHREAVAASAAKSNFLATMSHEIRTPLNGIMSLVELLQETPLDPSQRKHLHTVQRSCSTLLTVISDILDFSKIEAGKIELEQRPFSLTTLIGDIIDIFQPLAEEKGVDLTIACGSHVPELLMGDDNRLTQVLNNLISNALKFTDRGDVQLMVDCSDQGAEAVVKFQVRDQGIGMSREQISHVFEKFTQADSSTTRRYGGTGLGLAISRQLVELMGGTIVIDSESGKGTTVTCTVPFLKAQGEECKPNSFDTDPPARMFSGGVLVVEDNAVNQYVMKAMLSSLGCDVIIAENGRSAIEVFGAGDFELIFMDIQMPEMDGVETTRRIRAMAGGDAVPIVALTANALASDRDRCMKAGMNSFLLKPVTKRQLIDCLTASLPI